MTTTLDKLQEHLATPTEDRGGYYRKPIAAPIKLADGSTMSVQASEFHYCSPRTNEGPYFAVEVWRCGRIEEWAEYTDEDHDSPYAYVPIKLVVAEIEKRGGFYE